jgi:alpha-galactosidase
MARKKIVLIGAGSMTFTPGLMGDFLRCTDLADGTLVLHDIDEERLSVMAKLGARLLSLSGAEAEITSCPDREEALKGADFVISTFAVGGIDAWRQDVEIPMKYGICQPVGDSVGPGGLSRALRHAPVMVGICSDMRAHCPDAWLLNYANPLSCNCIAARKAGHTQTIGLCHGIYGTERMLADFLEIPAGELHAEAAGINHLTWILDLRRGAEDLYPLLREKIEAEKRVPFPVSAKLYRLYGCFPSPGDVHVAEFYPFFLSAEAHMGAKWGLHTWDAGRAAQGRAERWEHLAAQAEGEEPIDELPRSGERAIDIISAIVLNKQEPHVVNIPNRGAIDGLPDDAIVEVPAIVGADGVKGVRVGPLPAGVLQTLGARILQQELTVDAALWGDSNLVLQALLGDPLVTNIEMAPTLLEELLHAHSEHLERFRPYWHRIVVSAR